jgi:hypothetical protein
MDGSGIVKFPSDAIARPVSSFRTRCVAIVLGGGTNVVASALAIQ